MKLKGILVISFFCFCLQADEFMESATTVGGYGELHYDMEANDGDGKLDFHRFILYFKHNFNENWSLMSEIEIEHNMVYSEGDGGYLAMEQAYLNYWNGNWGFQGGVLLVPVGIINEHHEPPTFMSVERPEYNKYIIPTTWFDNGFAFYGKMGDFKWKYSMTGDLDGDAIGDGIKSARLKGVYSKTSSWTKTIQGSWTGLDGLKIGGSMTTNDAPVSAVSEGWEYTTINVAPTCTGGDAWGDVSWTDEESCIAGPDGDADATDDNQYWEDATTSTTAEWIESTPATTIGVNLTEFNATYSKNNVYVRMEHGSIDYTDNSAAESSSGYYLDLGYNIADMVGCKNDLYLWTRTSSYSKDDDDEHTDNDISLFGLTYKPSNNISIKFEMGSKNYWKKTDDIWAEKEDDIMRLGLGYMF